MKMNIYCHGVIPNTFIACGEGGQYCSDVCMLHAALMPFVKAAIEHGVRGPSPDDLWVSLGVPASAWKFAVQVLGAEYFRSRS